MIKLFSPYVLRVAYQRVKQQGGSAGVDGQKFVQDRGKRSGRISEGAIRIAGQANVPSAVKQVWIEKRINGDKRPLDPYDPRSGKANGLQIGHRTDFEADFEGSSYGFRPRRSASDTMSQIKVHLERVIVRSMMQI
ncbi:MAG: hypothetical protein R3B93_01525 [Bacteroidia bacterium]